MKEKELNQSQLKQVVGGNGGGGGGVEPPAQQESNSSYKSGDAAEQPATKN